VPGLQLPAVMAEMAHHLTLLVHQLPTQAVVAELVELVLLEQAELGAVEQVALMGWVRQEQLISAGEAVALLHPGMMLVQMAVRVS
jgi:hypothetical protein